MLSQIPGVSVNVVNNNDGVQDNKKFNREDGGG